MQTFMKAAAAASAVGLLAFGAVAAGGGSAFASAQSVASPAYISLGNSVTGCGVTESTLSVGLIPNCLAGAGTVDNPTSVSITLDTSALAALSGEVTGLGMKATWTLSCSVNGATVSKNGSYTVTSTSQSPSDRIDLATLMGSPEPNSCTVSDLTVATTLALNEAALGLSPFTVGVAANATTAVPGAIYQDEGMTSGGASATLCADDTANGNGGSKIQAYQCMGDLADYFAQTGAGQLVHNGDCLSLSGSRVVLGTCLVGVTSQEWQQSTVGGELQNKSNSLCLTAPSMKNGTQLTITSCAGRTSQKWHIPAWVPSVLCGVRVPVHVPARAASATRAGC